MLTESPHPHPGKRTARVKGVNFPRDASSRCSWTAGNLPPGLPERRVQWALVPRPLHASWDLFEL